MNRQFLAVVGTIALSFFARSAHAQPTVVVHGDAACPSAEMIRAALPVAVSETEQSGQTVTVDAGPDRLSLSLGETAVREIPADPDCLVRAKSVAVVIAAWSGELGARPTDSPDLTVAKSAPPSRPAAKPAHVLEVDAEAFYSPLWGHAFGGWLRAGRTPRAGGFGVRAMGGYQSARDVALDGGTNQLLRILVGAALAYDLHWRRVFAASDLGLIGTLTRAEGSGYADNRTVAAMNIGGLVDVRAGLGFGRVYISTNARLLRLLHDETIRIQSTSPGVGDSAVLTAWDLQLGVGLGVRFE